MGVEGIETPMLYIGAIITKVEMTQLFINITITVVVDHFSSFLLILRHEVYYFRLISISHNVLPLSLNNANEKFAKSN